MIKMSRTEKVNYPIISNLLMTTLFAFYVWLSIYNNSQLLAILLITYGTGRWFYDIGRIDGMNKASSIILKRFKAVERVLERYAKGEIKEINEQVLDQEMSLNNFYK